MTDDIATGRISLHREGYINCLKNQINLYAEWTKNLQEEVELLKKIRIQQQEIILKQEEQIKILKEKLNTKPWWRRVLGW